MSCRKYLPLAGMHPYTPPIKEHVRDRSFQLYFFNWFNTLPALSERTTTAPARIAISLMTRRPAPVSKGNPCSPLPKSGTHTSGVVTRKDKVPNVMTIASPAPTKPVFGETMPQNVKIPIPIIKIPNP